MKSNQITISGPIQSGKFTLAKLLATYLRSLGFAIELDLLGECKDPDESDLYALKLREIEAIKMCSRSKDCATTITIVQEPRVEE